MPLVVLVGDSCSGKTTVLGRLSKLGYAVVFEEGWKQIPRDIEVDKVRANEWFCEYFAQRDFNRSRTDVVLERCLQFQFPFTAAQYLSGKISASERDRILDIIDRLARKVPLPDDVQIIHLVCDSGLILKRLRERLGAMADQCTYWDTLRQETENYFQNFSGYSRIDTSCLAPDEVLDLVLSRITQRENKNPASI